MNTRPLHRHRVLIDTSGYFALAAPRDQHHTEALAIEARLIAQQWRPFTTNFILAETHALCLTRIGRDQARATLAQIRASAGTTIIRVTPADEQRAWAMIDHYRDKNYSFVDASSFVIMQRLAIDTAFTFDGNFTEHGLTVLHVTNP